MSFLRSILHMAWLVLTVIPYTLAIIFVAVFFSAAIGVLFGYFPAR